jgi:poly(A) polymerase
MTRAKDKTQSRTAQQIECMRIDLQQHGISPALVDAAALRVVEGLRAAGFEALLVGGCVRDLLLGLPPKDFDVATSATPEEVKRVFSRARLIGRRFRIAHVRFGREVVEVSTFRGKAAPDDEATTVTRKERARQPGEQPLSARSAQGVLLRDNVYGSIDEDAFRRDFTINALYYDPLSQEVIDYTGGVEDLRARRLRLIGEPARRYREDPVRILRAIRFAAKLGFELEPATKNAIAETVHLVSEVAPARLFDEMCKLFLSGHAHTAWQILVDQELTPYLFPDIDPAPQVLALIEAAMRGTDVRIADGRPVTPGFLLAALLWDLYQQRLALHIENLPAAEARESASSEAIRFQAEIMSIPRRFSQFIKEVWLLQPRLEVRQARAIDRLVKHPRFRAAYDFLLLRAETGEVPTELAEWWTRYQETGPDERAAMRQSLERTPKKRRRSRRPPKTQP